MNFVDGMVNGMVNVDLYSAVVVTKVSNALMIREK